MTSSETKLDPIDQRILDLLRDDGREPAASIAPKVGLSPAAVRRRIARLEREVIVRYTVVVDHDKVGPSLEAYVEVNLTGETDVQQFVKAAVKRPEIREASAIAGEPDAILRLRVNDVDHLRNVVTELRKEGYVTRTRTLVALGRERHAAEERA